MIPAELATPDLLKTKVFWNEGSDIMISIHDGKIKILSSSSDYVVNVVMLPSFGYSSIFYEGRWYTDLSRKLILRGGLGSRSIIWDWH